METTTLTIEDPGPSKIAVAKIIKTNLAIGLKETKDLIDSCPCNITEMPIYLAQQIAREIQDCGGRAYTFTTSKSIYRYQPSIIKI